MAFLRAINVGGHTVTMARLRELVGELGYADVATFIASGNLIVTTDRTPRQVEKDVASGLEKALGYAVETYVRTPVELSAIGEAEPFGTVEDGHKVQVGFLTAALKADAARAVEDLSNDYDTLRVDGREIYWHTRGGVSGSLIKPAVFARTLTVPTTMRNVNTIRRLVAKYPPG
ncbi:hypothetical protein VV02_15405 [Luteipulveratus mongoliensis]|uniref:Pyridoxamine 5-phosphate oxidase n=1 Tax=Luteipulveratus mongoliensis TaxID=571913 RepID=A0A0K1JJM5_9MICO|nr:hypothetical protein VV02_15405 [Luteipulveratus mongoliensis]